MPFKVYCHAVPYIFSKYPFNPCHYCFREIVNGQGNDRSDWYLLNMLFDEQNKRQKRMLPNVIFHYPLPTPIIAKMLIKPTKEPPDFSFDANF